LISIVQVRKGLALVLYLKLDAGQLILVTDGETRKWYADRGFTWCRRSEDKI